MRKIEMRPGSKNLKNSSKVFKCVDLHILSQVEKKDELLESGKKITLEK